MNDKKRPVHPRYLIRIRGCSPKVYAVVHNADVYARLLHTRPIITEHARGGDFFAAVEHLDDGPDGCDRWVGKDIDTTDNVETDVMEDGIEVGQPSENDWESEYN